jgi:hypothetical protein
MERWESIQAAIDEIVRLLGNDDPRANTFRRSVDGDALSRLVEGVLADGSLDIAISSRALWLAALVPTGAVTDQVVAAVRMRPSLAGIAADAVDRIRDASTLPALQAILMDRTLPAECRAAAARGMEWLFDPDAKTCLLRILRAPNEGDGVLMAALAALGMSQLHERTTDAAGEICRLLLSEVPEIRDTALASSWKYRS